MNHLRETFQIFAFICWSILINLDLFKVIFYSVQWLKHHQTTIWDNIFYFFRAFWANLSQVYPDQWDFLSNFDRFHDSCFYAESYYFTLKSRFVILGHFTGYFPHRNSRTTCPKSLAINLTLVQLSNTARFEDDVSFLSFAFVRSLLRLTNYVAMWVQKTIMTQPTANLQTLNFWWLQVFVSLDLFCGHQPSIMGLHTPLKTQHGYTKLPYTIYIHMLWTDVLSPTCLPSLKQHSTWKMMVGIVSFWGPAYFQGQTVRFRECIHFGYHHPSW